MRLIDAEELEEKAAQFPNTSIWVPIEAVWDAPTIDAVPVVRCKDCKHGEVDDPKCFPDLYYCHEGCGWNKAHFYCADGERKDGGKDG